MTILADDLLVLLLDPASGKPCVDGTKLDFALAGALLVDLAMERRIDAVGTKPRRATVAVVDPTPPADDVLAEAVRRVGQREQRADQLVPALAKALRPRLLERAVRRGDVRREHVRVLGLVPRDRWPAADTRRRRALRQRLSDVLLIGTTPDPRTAALIGLLSAIDSAPALVDAPDRATRKAVSRRAKEIGEGAWAAQGVRQAVEAVQAAVTAATTAAVAAATVTTTTS